MFSFFFFNETAATVIYTKNDTLSLHDTLPIAHEPDTAAGINRRPLEVDGLFRNFGIKRAKTGAENLSKNTGPG